MRELEKQLGAAQEELRASRKLQAALESRHPQVGATIEAALQAERALQEERNRRVRRPGWLGVHGVEQA